MCWGSTPGTRRLGGVATVVAGALGTLGACGLLLLFATAPGAGAATTATVTIPTRTTTTPAATVAWQAPVSAGAGNSVIPPSFDALSCPTSTFCAGIASPGYEGDNAPGVTLETTTAPLGTGAWSTSQTPVDESNMTAALSCPTVDLCVAVDDNGNVSTTTDPRAPAPTWSTENLENPVDYGDGNYAFDSISCPSDHFCAAVDLSGNLWTSTDPASGDPAGGTWHKTYLAATLTSVSCTSAKFCVTTADPASDPGCDVSGSYCPPPTHPVTALVSNDPTGGADRWKRLKVSLGLDSVSCPSTRRCVAVDSGSGLWVTNAPSSQGAWTRVPLPRALSRNLSTVACPSTRSCLATDGSQILTAVDPAAQASAWHAASIDHGHSLGALSCPSPTACLVTDDLRVFASAKPSGGAAAWHPRTAPTRTAWLGRITCPSSGLCLADSQNGRVVYSTAPGTGAWQAGAAIGASAVACPTTSLCVAVDPAGLEASSDPTGPASSWQSVEVAKGLSAIACGSASLCVATGPQKDIYTSTTPAVAGSWHDVENNQEYADAVFLACATSGGACVSSGPGVGESQAFLAASDPTSAISWQPVTRDAQDVWSEAWCGLGSMCLVVGNGSDSGGTPADVLASDDPTGGNSAWTQTSIPVPSTDDGEGAVAIDAVACATASVCLAVDSSGSVWTSSGDPTTAGTTWTATAIDPGVALNGIACSSSTTCVATDNSGDVLTATIAPVMGS